MISFILSLIGTIAVAAIFLTIGAVAGLLIAVEAVVKGDKTERVQLTQEIKEYWDDKKKE